MVSRSIMPHTATAEPFPLLEPLPSVSRLLPGMTSPLTLILPRYPTYLVVMRCAVATKAFYQGIIFFVQLVTQLARSSWLEAGARARSRYDYERTATPGGTSQANECFRQFCLLAFASPTLHLCLLLHRDPMLAALLLCQ